MGCAMATAKRRRKQAKMVKGRKPPKFDWKQYQASRKRAAK